MEYRVEELARAAHTSIRNVRNYQERGLLPAPRREGRIAWYDESHLARLRVIGTMLDRGFSLASIAELLGKWESGADLAGVLGLEAALTTPFTSEAPRTISVGDLAKRFGTVNPLALARAIEVGILAIDGAKLVAPSMRLVDVGTELVRAGIPLEALFEEVASLKSAADGIAKRFVALVGDHVFVEFKRRAPESDEARKLAAFVERVRPMAELAVTTVLAQSLEKYVRKELVERLAGISTSPRAESRAPHPPARHSTPRPKAATRPKKRAIARKKKPH